MNRTTVRIDGAGRVVLPKPLRERFRLRGGDTLAIEIKGDVIELRAQQTVGKLQRVNGVLVYSAPGALTSEDFVEQSRAERIEYVMGRAKDER